MSLILPKLSPENLLSCMPGVSSVITKLLSDDIKGNQKVKIEFLGCWEVILIAFFKSKA